jgi:hypothetical protein
MAVACNVPRRLAHVHARSVAVSVCCLDLPLRGERKSVDAEADAFTAVPCLLLEGMMI